MSKTGKAIETLKRCLETGDPTGGIEALERVTERLLEVVAELAQLKRRLSQAEAAEWAREFEAGVISPSEIDDSVPAKELRREPHAEERGDNAHHDRSDDVALGDRRDE